MKKRSAPPEVLDWRNRAGFGVTIRDVESPFCVCSIDSIKAVSIQIYETDRPSKCLQSTDILGPNFIVCALASPHTGHSTMHVVRALANYLIGVNQVFVYISQDCALGLKRKEERRRARE